MMEKIKAAIFDMDGVISETEVIHARVESELLKKHGIDIRPDEITRLYAGLSDKEFLPKIFADNDKPMPDFTQLVEEKWARIEDAAKGNVRAIPGTKDFLKLLKARGLPLALASASRMSFIGLVLDELKLRDMFDVVVSAEEVRNGKPAPDVFLLAAERLGISPEDCLVIEDAPNGMLAAKRAGIQCVGLVKDVSRQGYAADLLVTDLRDVPTDQIF
jgi:beta-phosphoglucomutase family hydrolase